MRPRSGGGIAAIGRRFRIADDDRNRKLSHEEVVKMFNDLQLGFSQKEMQILFLALDADGSGHVSPSILFSLSLTAFLMRMNAKATVGVCDGSCCAHELRVCALFTWVGSC